MSQSGAQLISTPPTLATVPGHIYMYSFWQIPVRQEIGFICGKAG